MQVPLQPACGCPLVPMSPSCLRLQAMEPFFSVLLSAIFLGDAPTLPVVMTLFPIVGGVAMASISEATFNWPGFIAAMGSNVTFQSRNVFSKKFMGKGKVRSAWILAAARCRRLGSIVKVHGWGLPEQASCH